MHGEGMRRVCAECGAGLREDDDNISHRELRGPSNITSSNIDRFFDYRYRRFLLIEEKHALERPMKNGQRANLFALAQISNFTCWVAKGTTAKMTVWRLEPLGFVDGEPKCRIVEIAGGIDFAGYQRLVTEWFSGQAPANE